MPVVFRHEGYTFFFYSNEGNPREPLHIPVRKGESIAKIWLEPSLGVATSYKLDASELRELAEIAFSRRQEIEEKWNEFFG